MITMYRKIVVKLNSIFEISTKVFCLNRLLGTAKVFMISSLSSSANTPQEQITVNRVLYG